jgi:hypothetical protein
MLKKKKVWGLILLACFATVVLVYAQTEAPSSNPQQTVSVLGRLALEKHGQQDWLVLHAKDADTYLITGTLIEKLKGSLQEFGENNLVLVSGNKSGRYNISCERTYKYVYDDKGKKELKVAATCIRYNILEVAEIVSAKKSDEEIPPPKREIEEEKKLTESLGKQPLLKPIMGEIYGKIKSLNLKSPIKTIAIVNRDKNSPVKKITLIISGDTRIVKKTAGEEPIPLMKEALKVGQEVTVVYSKTELKSEAIFITITKE